MRQHMIVVVSAVAAVLLAGCDRLVAVPAPSRVVATTLDDPSNAPLLMNGVAADFECAFGQYVVAQGLVGNELEVATGLIVMKEYDRRDFKSFGSSYAINTCAATFDVGVYKTLSIARWGADHLDSLLTKWTDAEVPGRQSLLARSAVYAGFSLVLLGESMCSAAIDLGPELSPAQLFQLAEARFTTA